MTQQQETDRGLDRQSSIRLSPAMHAELKRLAEMEDRDVAYLIRRAISQYLTRNRRRLVGQ